MKRKMILMPLLTVALLGACTNKVDYTPVDKNKETIKVGILQPVEHVALGAARKGFEDALKAANLPNKIDIAYSNAGGNDADLVTLAKNLIDSCDLSLGIGTGASKALLGAQVNAGLKKPLLFTAVTDPVDAGLVKNADNPSGYVCGTTDANPVEAQIALIKEFKSSATKVGIMYTQTEENSKVQSDQAEAAIKAAGMTASVKTCTNSSDIKATAEALVAEGVDAIYLPTDNNIAANMNAVKQAAVAGGTLVVAGEEGMLEEGGHITLSIDYYNLGKNTGEMAASLIKNDTKPTDYKVVAVPASNCSYVYSSKNLADAGLSMPEALKNAHEWKDVNA